jgi:hypothetical protein
MSGGSQDRRKFQRAVERAAAQQHHGREYLVAAVSVAGGYAGKRYGVAWLAWLAAAFLWLAILSYTSKALHGSRFKTAIQVVAAVAIAIGTYGLATPAPELPIISIQGQQVALFKPGYDYPYANVFFQNIGGSGHIVGYSYGALALSSAEPVEIKKELDKILKELVSQDKKDEKNVFALRPQDKRWFTVVGPMLTKEQAEGLRSGKYAFYFSGVVVVRGGPMNYDFCGFVIGNKPDVILECPEQ